MLPFINAAFDSTVMDAIKAMIDINTDSIIMLVENDQFSGILTERTFR